MKMIPQRRRITRPIRHRSAIALVAVLVVLVLLSLAAYTFSKMMVTEYQATIAYGRQVQIQAWAHSGPEYVAALLARDNVDFHSNLFNNPTLFHVPLADDGGFTVVSPVEDPLDARALNTPHDFRLGLIDESSRININVLANPKAFKSDEVAARELLLTLPEMTETLADTILDWVDPDEVPREFGTEFVDTDRGSPLNRPLGSLEELLLVEGVTPELLYGEDANRNGILDDNEDDGDALPPFDNADGVLDLGWIAYLTLDSRESNLRHTGLHRGESRIYLNQTDLARLYDEVEAEFGTEAAKFVVLFRLKGAASDSTEKIIPIYSVNPLSASKTVQQLSQPVSEENSSDEASSNSQPQVTRGGLDLSGGPAFEIKSLYHLMNSVVVTDVDGERLVLKSPWQSGDKTLPDVLPRLFDTMTVTDAPVVSGRININEARKEVLLGIPEMPPKIAEAIAEVRSRRLLDAGERELFSTTGWLLTDGLADVTLLRLLDGFITAQGDVYRMQVVGHADGKGPMMRIESVVDSSEKVPRILRQRDLTQLGAGFRREDLGQFGATSSTRQRD